MGSASHSETTPALPAIGDKTLVAWVYLDNLSQRGGSALTLDDRKSGFDGIVFGEIASGRWMAGSDGFHRTQMQQDGCVPETADPATRVQIAVVYAGNQITIYRNGAQYERHDIAQPRAFGSDSVVLMGLRHLEAGDRACFAGSIEDARIYDCALSAAQISALEANKPSAPKPLAWWSFEDGKATDIMGRFTECMLVGGAYVAGGRLHLNGQHSTLICAPKDTLMTWLSQSATRQYALITAGRELRERLLADPQRPTYHFVAPEGRCMPFDPNGALFWRGKYHLCYIFQNERGHCWGHASSKDLLHWRFHTPALAPHPGEPDRGIFSGNAFISKNGEAVMLYHGCEAGNCIALSSEEDLDHWNKLPTNPIVPIPREGDPNFGKYSSWDPHGWLEGDTYYAIFGGNPATLFKSPNLTHWEFLHRFPAADMPGVDKDEDISCPDFFRLGNRYMLLCISHKRGCRYYLGRFDNEQFIPEMHARMNWPGGTCFAPESLLDDKGRRIMWAWALDGSIGDNPGVPEWSGVMTLPRVLSLADDGILRIEPVEELASLRMNHRHFENLSLSADVDRAVPGATGDCLELDLTLEMGRAQESGLKVRCSPSGEEETSISYDAARKCIRVDVSKSTQNKSIIYRTFCMTGIENPPVTTQEAPFELKPGEPLRLRIFLDRSIIEVFANDRQCVTQRVYPTRPDSTAVKLFSRGGSARIKTLDAWSMAPANPW